VHVREKDQFDMSIAPPESYDRPALSTREIEVLRHWLRGESKQAVANDLRIALGTVNTHLTRIREKYALVGRDASSKPALLVRALQDGILTIAEL
jgi:DNA-binding CsgD family transcriptional regulator